MPRQARRVELPLVSTFQLAVVSGFSLLRAEPTG
jgi:hypothetical protein